MDNLGCTRGFFEEKILNVVSAYDPQVENEERDKEVF